MKTLFAFLVAALVSVFARAESTNTFEVNTQTGEIRTVRQSPWQAVTPAEAEAIRQAQEKPGTVVPFGLPTKTSLQRADFWHLSQESEYHKVVTAVDGKIITIDRRKPFVQTETFPCLPAYFGSTSSGLLILSFGLLVALCRIRSATLQDSPIFSVGIVYLSSALGAIGEVFAAIFAAEYYSWCQSVLSTLTALIAFKTYFDILVYWRRWEPGSRPRKVQKIALLALVASLAALAAT